MIKLVRIDHRLLHGQVAFSWTNAVGADCILIANDEVVNNEIQMTTLKLAKPHGTKLVIKNIEDSITALNSGVTDKYKLLIVISSIDDANRLAQGYDGIQSINLGGIKAKEGTRMLSHTINVLPEEEETLKEMINRGLELEIRQVPTDKKVYVQNVI